MSDIPFVAAILSQESFFSRHLDPTQFFLPPS
jgi:hypothetical protein